MTDIEKDAIEKLPDTPTAKAMSSVRMLGY